MRRFFGSLVAALTLLIALPALALDQAQPGALPTGHPAAGAGMQQQAAALAQQEQQAQADAIRQQDRSVFVKKIRLDDLRLLAINHLDHVKILDSWARQSLSAIANRQKILGQDPLYTALDIAFRPEAYFEQNIIYVRDVPIRQALAEIAPSETEGDRILHTGKVSAAYLSAPAVQRRLQQIALETVKARSVGKLQQAYATFMQLEPSLEIVPPGADQPSLTWHHPDALLANTGVPASIIGHEKLNMPRLAGFTDAQARNIVLGYSLLAGGWRSNDATAANQGIALLASTLPAINPPAYPSSAKRNVELIYNETFNGTIDAFVYFVAFALFAVAAIGEARKVRRVGVAFFTLAIAYHIASMATRWYLAGRIPIQNQFESVLGAALFGCIVGYVLEMWRKNSLYGMAASFVGFLAMTACFVFPFVVGVNMGADIGTVAGILSNTIWLYIHVNVVIASYALISASFVLGAYYLCTLLWYWINPLEAPDATRASLTGGPSAGGGGAAVLAAPAAMPMRLMTLSRERSAVLEQLDSANMVVLQMAFWLLGIGIVLGAIWANVSWGRPWGWDPKETFALVTWIVYLVIVHVRVVSPRMKGAGTAVLSIVGFGIMLFNWIGVNFWLVGLHSYA